MNSTTVYAGVDGEGRGRKNHKYILLSCKSEDGEYQDWVEDEEGLSTADCLNFLLDIPKGIKCFAFSFNYDLTKILTDVDNKTLYMLCHPELRQGKHGPRALSWGDYKLNLQGTKFWVSCPSMNLTRIVWDTFKFYQSKFVSALDDWKIGDKEHRAAITKMKDARGEFDKKTIDEIRSYCLDECQDMGQLTRKLTTAHASAGLTLRNFYGAGSTGGSMLEIMRIGEKRGTQPQEMMAKDGPVMRAFFGGRFEHSVIGPIEGPVFSYDISSAYPYQCFHLPCLQHGQWRLTRDRKDLERCRTAVVKYAFSSPLPDDIPWAPFPFRDDDGTIVFPSKSGGGWVWLPEFLEGEKLFSVVEFVEAWVLENDCECKPFHQIANWYCERLRIGKEGPGIVLKLGCNSVYGKLAQSVGTPPFQSWIWAGLITSGCRAQILQMLGLHEKPENLLAVATDGIYTREDLATPIPLDTGTAKAKDEKGEYANKPLGGWEKKIVDKGVFFARPGIYFPLNPTEDELKKVRARGIGRAAMMETWKMMVDAWAKGEELIELETEKLTRFMGMKNCISVRNSGKKELTYHRAKEFGQWVPRKIIMSLNPLPKRDADITRTGVFGILRVRMLPRYMYSAPYDANIVSEEALQLKQAANEAAEQPDGEDLTTEWGIQYE